jgi:hypothetical protein
VPPLRLAADTRVFIELAEAVNSANRNRGDKFAIRLAAPIIVDGQIAAPAGATGVGEVVYAERGGAGGSPGKLVLAARYIDAGEVHIHLKAFTLAAAGDSDFRELQVASEFIGPAVMFIHGHNVLYPEGTRARAKVSEDAVLPPGPAAPASPTTPAPPTPALANPRSQESPK